MWPIHKILFFVPLNLLSYIDDDSTILFSLMERSLTWYCQLRFISVFTPRYLTLSVGIVFYHTVWFLNHLQISFAEMYRLPFQFFLLSQILFAFNHFARCFKSALTSSFSFLIELLRHKRLKSSAKWWTLQNFIAWLRSFIYSKNRRGPRTDLWGTPQFKAARPGSCPFIDTYWLRLDR